MDVTVAPSAIAGTGCFAARNFRKGERIGEYTGVILTWEEAEEKYHNASLTYLFDLGDGSVIDAAPVDNPLKYINHSCEPNCVSDQRGKHIYIKALRDIEEGEEFSYDYNLILSEGEDPSIHACSCGAKQCRGTQLGA